MNVAEIRQHIATTIDKAIGTTAIGTSTGWTESPAAPDLYGASESENMLHRSYAVVPGESGLARNDERQVITGDALPLVTPVTVRWAYEVAALEPRAGYDAALAVERTMIAAIMTGRRAAGMRLTFVRARRGSDDTGFVRGEIELNCQHAMDLTM